MMALQSLPRGRGRKPISDVSSSPPIQTLVKDTTDDHDDDDDDDIFDDDDDDDDIYEHVHRHQSRDDNVKQISDHQCLNPPIQTLVKDTTVDHDDDDDDDILDDDDDVHHHLGQ